MKDPIEDARRYLARADASPAGRAHVRKVLEDRDAWCQTAMGATRERNEARAEVERLRVERDKARAVVCFQVEAAKLDGYRPGYHAKIPWLAMLEVQEAHEAAKRGA